MPEQTRDHGAAGNAAAGREPARRRSLAGAAMLAVALGLAALMLAAWPVSTADAARIIWVWDEEHKKWVCHEEQGTTGRLMVTSDAVATMEFCYYDQEQWVCRDDGFVGSVALAAHGGSDG